ncbi:MAG: hypothetical protein KIT84_32065 [Labilithrix sp.]|nr:hypothetical protein [Labilithrix sp.]MCW5815708.1 hypothetical protein [Labilithrix sp.]
MRPTLFFSVLALMVAAPAALVACSGDQKEETSSSESEINRGRPAPEGGEEGDYCWSDDECADGLLCKKRPSGPPPGAVGLPIPSDDESARGRPSGPPPGAVGLPLPPNTCQEPAEGEKGSTCYSTDDCNAGLECSFDDGHGSSTGGPPPGAVGLPIPAGEGHSFPPGAVGMPVFRQGKCAETTGSSSSGGPPPGAVGLPILP